MLDHAMRNGCREVTHPRTPALCRESCRLFRRNGAGALCPLVAPRLAGLRWSECGSSTRRWCAGNRARGRFRTEVRRPSWVGACSMHARRSRRANPRPAAAPLLRISSGPPAGCARAIHVASAMHLFPAARADARHGINPYVLGMEIHAPKPIHGWRDFLKEVASSSSACASRCQPSRRWSRPMSVPT